MRIRALAVIAVFAFGCVHVDTVACAADRYVSTTGSPLTGDGSKANPWATIAQADLSGKLQPGDVVHVAPGTYTAHVRTYTSGKAGEPITYVSDTLWGAVLPGGWSNHANYIKIVDFEVAGSTGECGIYTDGAHTVIVGNKVHGVLPATCNSDGGAGIDLNGLNSQVIGNYVYGNGPQLKPCAWVHGIYFLQAGGVAANNVVFGNAGWGIQMWHYTTNETINNNTVFNNATGCIVVGASDGTTNDNTIVDNNICYKNRRGIAEEGATGRNNVYHNNLLYLNSGRDLILQTGTASGTVSADPRFVRYAVDTSEDVHLASGSKAIDGGLSRDTTPGGRTVTFTPYDFHNLARPQGCCFDIGAKEHIP